MRQYKYFLVQLGFLQLTHPTYWDIFYLEAPNYLANKTDLQTSDNTDMVFVVPEIYFSVWLISPCDFIVAICLLTFSSPLIYRKK